MISAMDICLEGPSAAQENTATVPRPAVKSMAPWKQALVDTPW